MVGFCLGYLILWFAQPLIGESNYFKKIFQVLGFIAFFLWQLLLSCLRVAYYVVMPLNRMRPAVVAVPLDVKTDDELLLLTTVVTLTPGSLSLTLSDDKKVLYLHAMSVDDPDALRKEIKNGFERRVIEVLR
jgi:multicomponent Na+:H+ antiporter subunit E